MKKYILLAVAAIAALVLSGCVLGVNDGDGGTLSLNFSAAPKAPGDHVARVWVYAGNSLLPGGPHSAALVDGRGAVTVDGIPAGGNYRVVVLTSYDFGDGYIEHQYAASSKPIAVTAGVESVVEIPYLEWVDIYMTEFYDMYENPITVTGIKSLAMDYYGSSYAATSTTVYEGSGSYWEYVNPPSSINSLSMHENYGLLVNTAGGIYNSSNNPVGNWGDAAPSVLQSGGDWINYIYRAATEFGGGQFGGESDYWNRIDLGASSGRRVLDIHVFNPEVSVAFVATNFVGAFIMPFDYLNPAEYDLLDILLLDPNQRMVLYPDIFMFADDTDNWGANKPSVQTARYDNYYGQLYLGTANGLYVVPVYWDGSLEGPAALIPGTEGLNIIKVYKTSNSNPVFITRDGLVGMVKPDGTVYHLPFISQFTGPIRDIVIEDIEGIVLIAAGDKGVAKLYASFFNAYF